MPYKYMKPVLYNDDFFVSINKIQNDSIDLILTDPPYGVFGKEKLMMDWDIMPPIDKMFELFDKVLKPNGQALIFCDMMLLLELMARHKFLFHFRYHFIWKKSSPMPISIFRPLPETEFILVYKKKNTLESNLTWNPQFISEKREPYTKKNYNLSINIRKGKKMEIDKNENGWRHPRVILSGANKPNMKSAERSNHPTQKPEYLLRRLINTFTNKGDTVFDPFSGSASTLISAYKERRQSIGFELHDQYFDDAIRRINNVTSQSVLFS